MLRSSLFAVLALTSVGCDLLGGGSDEGFYLRFEPVPGTVFTGSSRPIILGDAVYWTSASDTMQQLGAEVLNWPLGWATVVDGTVYGLDQTTPGVSRTTDGVTFEPVSPEVFDQFGSVEGRLLGLRHKSMGRYTLFASDDLGLTWREVTDLTAGFEFGEGDSVWLSREAGGRARATIEVFTSGITGNTDSASQTYDVTAADAIVVGRTGNAEIERTPPPFPDFVSAQGLGFFPDRNGLISQLRVGDATSLVILRDPQPGAALTSGVRLRWALKSRGENTLGTELSALGVDSAGRLLVASTTQLYRTVRPLSTDDERADILVGPGCDGRSSWTAEWTDDTTDVTVRNDAGQRLQVWSIDTGMGWAGRGVLEVGAESSFSLMRNNRLMFTAPDDDTCIAVLTLPDEQTATLTVGKP